MFKINLLNIKSITKKSIRKFAPQKLKGIISRRFKRVNYIVPESICFKVADTQDELEQAFKLIHDSYVEKKFMKADESGMRISKYHALPSTINIIGKVNDRVVATISVIQDSPLGLPSDSIFDLGPCRKNGKRASEISALAIEKKYRSSKYNLFFLSIKYVYEHCVKYLNLDYWFISVDPKNAEFYQSFLDFKKYKDKEVKKYSYVEGAPAIGLCLDLKKFYGQVKSWKPFQTQNSMFSFLGWHQVNNFRHSALDYKGLPQFVMSPTMLDYFFNEKSDVFAQLNESERKLIKEVYPSRFYEEVLPKLSRPHETSDTVSSRFSCDMKARISKKYGRKLPLHILNVSETGLRAYCEGKLPKGDSFDMTLEIGDRLELTLSLLPVWQNNGFVGFKIESKSMPWIRYLKAHESLFSPIDDEYEEAS